MSKRCQSPSSINTYKQCPRKYYYQYILKLPTTNSIHTVRGHIVHSVLEDFFDLPLAGLTKNNFKPLFHQQTERLLVHHWRDSSKEFSTLTLDPEEMTHYFEETNLMLTNWVDKFSEKIVLFQSPDLTQSFKALTPIREQHFLNQKYNVQGFIDAIEHNNGKVRIMDYKTSARFHMSEEYKLQLAIYALLYQSEHDRPPDQVGLYFLKDTQQYEHLLDVTDDMIDLAKSEIEVVHLNTESNQSEDYPKREGPLCKWRTGQCDFYEFCFGQKKLDNFGINVKFGNGETTKAKSSSQTIR